VADAGQVAVVASNVGLILNPLGALSAARLPQAPGGSFGAPARPMVDVDLTDADRIPVGRVTAGLAGIQLLADLAGEMVRGLDNITGLLDRALAISVVAVNAAKPEEITPLQQAIDGILLGVDAVAEQTRFGTTPLLNGTVPLLAVDLGAFGPADRAELALPDVRTARLGASAGGQPLAAIGTGGPDALSGAPASTAAVIQNARGEVAAARGAAEDLAAAVLTPGLEAGEAALEAATVGDRTGADRDFSVDAFAQALAQGTMGASLQSVYRNMLPRERWVRMLSE